MYGRTFIHVTSPIRRLGKFGSALPVVAATTQTSAKSLLVHVLLVNVQGGHVKFEVRVSGSASFEFRRHIMEGISTILCEDGQQATFERGDGGEQPSAWITPRLKSVRIF